MYLSHAEPWDTSLARAFRGRAVFLLRMALRLAAVPIRLVCAHSGLSQTALNRAFTPMVFVSGIRLTGQCPRVVLLHGRDTNSRHEASRKAPRKVEFTTLLCLPLWWGGGEGTQVADLAKG